MVHQSSGYIPKQPRDSLNGEIQWFTNQAVILKQPRDSLNGEVQRFTNPAVYKATQIVLKRKSPVVH